MEEEEGLQAASDLADPADKFVLVVDDEESLRDLIELIVKKEGFRCDRAADGNEALRKAAALTPDLIILDLMLAKCRGGGEARP